MRLLVAHPDPRLRVAVRAALDGVEVIEAADAPEALVACAEHTPRVAVRGGLDGGEGIGAADGPEALGACGERTPPVAPVSPAPWGPANGAPLATIKPAPALFPPPVVVIAADGEEAAALEALGR